MRTFFVMAVILLFASEGVAWDGTYEIRSRTIDFEPGDGLFEAGSPSNPYTIQEHGRTLYEIRSRTTDFFPGDELFEAGSPSNPWVIKRK